MVRPLISGLCLLLLVFGTICAQETQEKGKIELSGMVVRVNSLEAIPYTNIYTTDNRAGTRANKNGFFTIDVNPSDTVVFSRVGSRTTYFIVPADMEDERYSLIQRMPNDTISLKEVEVISWPTISQFNEAFTREKGFDPQFNTALNNSNPANSSVLTHQEGSVDEAHYNFQQQGMKYGNRYSYVYENAHIPLNDVLNPKHWDRLMERWKQGQH